MPSTRPRKQPPPKPELFIDRDLGRYRIPEALREMGFTVHPMYEAYPNSEQQERDPNWIRESTEKGWVLICRDKLRHPGEKDAVRMHGARMFRVASSAKNAADEIRNLQNNINRIEQRARKAGPFIYRVDQHGIEKVFPKERP